jgi:hypothetical protein
MTVDLLSKNEMVNLAPLVVPMIRDEVRIYGPVPGGRDTAGVSIMYRGRYTTLKPVQYETFRTEVVRYIQDKIFLSATYLSLTKADIDRIIRERIETVFADA